MIRFLLALLVAAGFLLSLAAGKAWIAPWSFASGTPEALVLLELRLPRALLGLLVGAVLGAAGAVLQGYLRNPLAEPGVLGVSATAALGAVLAIFLGAGGQPLAIAATAMAFALGAVALLGLIAGASGLQLILAGVVLSSLAAALTSLLISLAPTPFALGEIVTWLMGALTDRTMADVRLLLGPASVSFVLMALAGRALDALALGEAAAASLGTDLARTRRLVVAGVGLGVGASVAVTGVISFVGLVVPHLLRPLVGPEPSRLLFPSALGGAALVLFADSLVRLAPGRGRAEARDRHGARRRALLPVAPVAQPDRSHITAPLLDAHGLAVRRNGFRLGPVDLALPAGRVCAILGPNGAGKSTLLLALAGLLPGSAGDIRLDGQPLARLERRARARLLAFLPQVGPVHWNLSARALVLLGRQPHRPPFGPPRQEDLAAVEEALAAVDTLHLADRPVDRLSGGERARVLFARVLAGRPRVILADEPLQNLDPAHQLQTVRLVRAAAEGGAAVAAVVHDLPLARRLADDVLLVKEGRLLASGPAEAVLVPETLAAGFGVSVSPELVPVAPAPAEARPDA